jgi:starvation-inducible DNA-binding protein
MPYSSDAQRKFFNVNRDKLEGEGVDVDEWNESSKGKKLPEHVKKSKVHLDGAALAILHPLVVGSTALALRTREAHWNVKGPNFGPLHELFGDFYDFVNDWADTLAERIVQQGGVAIALAGYDARPLIGDEKTLIQGIAGKANTLAELLHVAIPTLGDDESTKDVLIEYGRELEKWIWKIESHLQEFKKVEDAPGPVAEVEVVMQGPDSFAEPATTTTLDAIPQEKFSAVVTDRAIVVKSSQGRVFAFDENCKPLGQHRNASYSKAATEWLKAHFDEIVGE